MRVNATEFKNPGSPSLSLNPRSSASKTAELPYEMHGVYTRPDEVYTRAQARDDSDNLRQHMIGTQGLVLASKQTFVAAESKIQAIESRAAELAALNPTQDPKGNLDYSNPATGERIKVETHADGSKVYERHECFVSDTSFHHQALGVTDLFEVRGNDVHFSQQRDYHEVEGKLHAPITLFGHDLHLPGSLLNTFGGSARQTFAYTRTEAGPQIINDNYEWNLR